MLESRVLEFGLLNSGILAAQTSAIMMGSWQAAQVSGRWPRNNHGERGKGQSVSCWFWRGVKLCVSPACARSKHVFSAAMQCANRDCLAFSGHRYCCRQCRHSNGQQHGHGCCDRQRAAGLQEPRVTFALLLPDSWPAETRSFILDEGASVWARVLVWAVTKMCQELPPRVRSSMLRALLLALHPDRCFLPESHAVSQCLTALL